jgi:hypothetical protein
MQTEGDEGSRQKRTTSAKKFSKFFRKFEYTKLFESTGYFEESRILFAKGALTFTCTLIGTLVFAETARGKKIR